MKFIILNFEKWADAGYNFKKFGIHLKRIYRKKYIWTPFVLIGLHKIKGDIKCH
jgi:hypothetical protein